MVFILSILFSAIIVNVFIFYFNGIQRFAGMSFAANPVSCWVKDTETSDISFLRF